MQQSIRQNGRRSLALLALLAPLATDVSAQRFLPQRGGTILDNWVEPHPSAPGEFLVWTAEVGMRIRRFDTSTGLSTFEELEDGMDIRGALHRLFISSDLRWGFAVGSHGQVFWATDLATPSRWRRLDELSLAGGQHLWETIWNDAWEGSVWEREAWIAGEGPTLLHKEAGTDEFVSLIPAGGFDADLSGFLCLDFGDLKNTVGSRRGAAGGLLDVTGKVAGDIVRAIYYSDNGVDWFAGALELPVGWETGHNYSGELFVWAVDFVPGNPLQGYAAGGYGTGNGAGFTWSTQDGGQTWQPLYTECTHPLAFPCPTAAPIQPPGAPCTGEVPASNHWEGTHLQATYATCYDVMAQPDGSALVCAYAGGVFRINGVDPMTYAWSDVADSFEFATVPLWGLSESTGLDASGQPVTLAVLSGAFGDMRMSSDGGLNWSRIVGGKPWRLRDLAFGSDTTGWTVGQLRRIGKSTDGGQTWTEVTRSWSDTSIDQNVGLWAVAAASEDSAVVVGQGNGELHILYKPLSAPPPAGCEFDEHRIPGASGNGEYVLDVDTYGVNPSSGFPEYWVSARLNGVSALMRSIDGGASWSSLSIPHPNAKIYDVAVLDEDRAVIAGERQGAAYAAYCTGAASGNLQWTIISPDLALGATSLYGVDIASADDIVAVSQDGWVYRFDPALGTPRLVRESGAQAPDELRNVQYTSDATGLHIYASGEDGAVLHYDPLADAWELPHTSSADVITGLSFRNPGLGWIVGVCNELTPSMGVHSPFGFGDSTIARYQ